MILKVHEGADGSRVIAVCDDDLLGKRFEEKNLRLDLSTEFYNGERKEGETLLKEIRKGRCHLNIAGEHSVDFCAKNHLIEKKNTIKVDGIPHAQAIITTGE